MNQEKALETLASVYDMVAADVYEMIDTDSSIEYPVLRAIEEEIARLESIKTPVDDLPSLQEQVDAIQTQISYLMGSVAGILARMGKE